MSVVVTDAALLPREGAAASPVYFGDTLRNIALQEKGSALSVRRPMVDIDTHLRLICACQKIRQRLQFYT
jgi:hypothetical protein